MLVGAGLLVSQVILTNYVDSRESARTRAMVGEAGTTGTNDQVAGADEARTEAGELTPVKADAKRSHGAFGMIFGTSYLLMIGLMLMCLNWVNTTGEYILGSVVEDTARAAVAAGTAGGLSVEEYIGQFYSQFFGVVNVVGVVIQLFLVSRIIKYVGVRFAVMALPCLALGAYNVLAFYPVLAVVRWAKTAENATDYSLNNTVRNMLFLPCTREQKYSAKQAIDSFFVRIGDVLSAVLVFVGTTYFALNGGGFARFNILVVSVWLVLAFIIGREYRSLAAAGTPPGPRLISGSAEVVQPTPQAVAN